MIELFWKENSLYNHYKVFWRLLMYFTLHLTNWHRLMCMNYHPNVKSIQQSSKTSITTSLQQYRYNYLPCAEFLIPFQGARYHEIKGFQYSNEILFLRFVQSYCKISDFFKYSTVINRIYLFILSYRIKWSKQTPSFVMQGALSIETKL